MSLKNTKRRDFLRLAGSGLAAAALTRGQAGMYDVRAQGAAGDGKAIDTGAINKAIDAAAAAGGGTVVFCAYAEAANTTLSTHSKPTLLAD